VVILGHVVGRAVVGRGESRLVATRLLALPPSFFTIALGLAGLAGAWRTATSLYGGPAGIGAVLFVLAALVYLFLVGALIVSLIARPRTVAAELQDPAQSPFYSVVPITGMQLGLGLEPYAHGAAQALFLAFFTGTALFGGRLTGQWIAEPPGLNSIHPGYFLPTVTGGLIGGQGAAAFGLTTLGWMSFGIGVLSGLLLGTIILGRLFVGATLPAPLMPTMAIMVAVPALAGNAYAALTGGRLDMVAYGLAGYTLLLVLVEVRLFPLYRALPFAPTLWGFTFPYATVASYAMRWVRVEHLGGAPLIGYTVLGAITLFIGGIALQSLVSLREGRFLPA
jgi:tellurite resistance protein